MVRWLLAMWMMVGGAVLAESLDRVPLYRLVEGERVPFRLIDDTEYVAFYYSASWCPPCRKTTPPLVAEYERMLLGDKMPVEIVLVGSDQTEKKMFAYMAKFGMRWPAVDFGSRGLVQEYAAEGIPHMALVNRRTGEVVAHGTGSAGIEEVVSRMRDFSHVGEGKPFQAESWLSKYAVLIVVGLCFFGILFFQRWREKSSAKSS